MTVFLRRAAGSAVAVLLGATTLAVVPALLMSAPARAQAPAEAPAHTARQRFDIAAGDLDRVLNRFAVAAGLELSIDAGLTAGKTSPACAAATAPEGLAELLAGTGLYADFQGPRTVTVRASQARRLAPVSVRGTGLAADPGRTEDSGAYAAEVVTIGKSARSCARRRSRCR
ncbi:hypothetical protein HML84_16600 [Alcanivorax sp. IO_7]|nr:hypothetical protein HML84_16600 [Alcanivorax sp. IO_7]